MKINLFVLSILVLSLMSPRRSHAQANPVSWDQFEIHSKKTHWLYYIEFYKGTSVDSLRIISLKDTSRKATARMFPIASSYEAPEEVANQISAQLLVFDSKIPPDSIWRGDNPARLTRDLEILWSAHRIRKTKPIPKSGSLDSLKRSDSLAKAAADERIDSLQAKLDSITIKLDTLATRLLAGTFTKGSQVAGGKAGDSTASIKPGAAATDTSKKNHLKDIDNEEPDSTTNFYFTFLNAANFDFSGKLQTSYLGMLNLFSPKAFGQRFGFIAGIEKINYANGILGNDTAQTEYFTQNYVRPQDWINNTGSRDSVRSGATYQHEFNQCVFKSSNTAWSFYTEPIWKIVPLDKYPSDHNLGIYLHLHGEMMLNVWSRTQTETNLTDTALVYTPNGGPNNVWGNQIIRVQSTAPVVANKTIFTGLFGIGPTFFVNPFHNLKKDSSSRFFFQTTIGVAIDAPNFSALTNQSYPLAPNGTYEVATTYSKLKAFYLLKAHFIHNLSSNTQLIVGFLVRDLLPSQNPQYAAFIGLNVSVVGLLKLITGS
jgi:hypothetical protein